MKLAKGMAVAALGLIGWSLLCGATLSFAQSNAASPSTPQADQVSDEVRAREMIATACKDDPRLHGAWVWLAPDTAHQTSLVLKAQALVDSARAEPQRQLIQELLARLPLSPKPRLETPVFELPVSRLVEVLQAEAEKLVGRGGHYVDGVYYRISLEPKLAELELVPYGRGVSRLHHATLSGTLVRFVDAEWGRVKQTLGVRVNPVTEALLRQPMSDECRKHYVWLDRVLAEDSGLQGVRVDLEACRDHQGRLLRYDVYRFVDAARADEQRRRLSQLLDQRLAGTYEVIETVEWPVSRLLSRLNLELEARPWLDGCAVTGAHFAADYAEGERQLKLVLDGRVPKKQAAQDQQDTIVSLCDRLIKIRQHAAWEKYVNDFATQAQELVVVEPSLDRGGLLFSEGYELFWQGRYEAAREAFQQALLEVPDALPYRYWRILAELQAGRTTEAYEHMVAVLRRQPTPTAHRLVARSLQRVQGPVRDNLRKLELQACLDVDLLPNRVLPDAPQPPQRQAREPAVAAPGHGEPWARDETLSNAPGTALAQRVPAPAAGDSSRPATQPSVPLVSDADRNRRQAAAPLQTVVWQVH